MIVGLVKPNQGHVFIDDKEITNWPMNLRAKAGIGYLPQENSIFRKLTVEENIQLVLEMNDKLTVNEKKAKLEELLDEFGVARLRKYPAVALSGGERRRVEIARALAASPDFMLLDEPFAGIDPIAIGEIKDNIRKISAIGIRFSLCFAFLLTLVCFLSPRFVISLFTSDAEIIDTGADYLRIVCLSYLFFCLTQSLIASMRSVENAKIGLYVSISSLAVNITLNYILIYGKLGLPVLGVRGAAIATVISRIIEATIILIYVLFIDKKLKFRLKDILSFDKTLLIDFIKYGTPIVLGQLVWATNMLSNSAIMGRLDQEGVVAALSVAGTLGNLSYVVMNGMAGAVGIITGKTIGAGKKELMREYAKTVQIIFLALGILTGTVIFLIKDPFISLYNISSIAAKEASDFICVLSITTIGTCYQAACLFGLVKSGGDISFVFKNDAIFVFLIVIPSALIASRLGAAPWIVFLCLKSDQILKCFVAVVKINRFNWMKNLTRGATIRE